MPATQHSEFVNSPTDVPVDEIELIHILRVIWKWKYFIIFGTAVCAATIVVISFYMQPIYRVSMMLKSGLNKVNDGGKHVYLDSVQNFKAIIEGELLFKVLDHSKDRIKKGAVSSAAFKIKADKKKNTLRILHESANREEGIENLNYLSSLLIGRYEKKLKYLHDNYANELMTAKRQLEFGIDEEKFIASRLGDIQKGIERYAQEIEPLNGSYESHSKFREKLLSYSSLIQSVANLKRNYAEANFQINFYKNKIANLEEKKPSKQAVIVAQPPTASLHPIKPKKMRNVILAVMFGLFMMVFLSFFFEYIAKNRKKKS